MINDLIVHIVRPETVTGLLRVGVQYEQSILTTVRERGYWQPFRDKKETPKAGIKAMRLAPAERARRLKEGIMLYLGPELPPEAEVTDLSSIQ